MVALERACWFKSSPGHHSLKGFKSQAMKPQNQINLKSIENSETKTLMNNLSLTPEQRLINHQKALNLMRTLQNVRKEQDGQRS